MKKQTKRALLAWILALSMVAGLLPMSVFAVEVPEPTYDYAYSPASVTSIQSDDEPAPKSGVCGDNLTWVLDDEGTLTISGEGDMWDYSWDGNYANDAPWVSYSNQIIKVNVGRGVTSIGSNAFTSHSQVDAYNSLLQIDFEDGSELTRIEEYALSGCPLLRSIILPSHLEYIGAYNFYDRHRDDYSGLQYDSALNVKIPASVTYIDSQNFGVASYVAGNKHKIYGYEGSYAESYAKSNNIYFVACKSVQSDSDFEYYENTDGGITITYYNFSVSDVLIPDTLNGKPVTAIGDEENFPFENQMITSVTIPKTVNYIAPKAFFGTAISEIKIPNGVAEISNSAFRHCAYLNSISIPDSVVRIGAYAFADSGLEAIEIPDTVSLIDDQAFFGCVAIREINVVAANQFYSSINGVLFDRDERELICYPAGRLDPSYTIQNGVSVIKERAFSYSKVKSVVIPDSVTEFSYGFYQAISLESVNIPASATAIGDYAFYKCYNLVAILIPEGIIRIGARAFLETALTRIELPSSLLSMGGDAFCRCYYVTEVVFGANNRLTADSFVYMFGGNENIPISKIVMPENIFEGRENDFNNRMGLAPRHIITLVDFDGNPYYVADEYGVFYNKEKTSLVYCPISLEIDEYFIPEGVETVVAFSFQSSRIRSIILPNSLTNIGRGAFISSSIEGIIIPDGVEELNYGIFGSCIELKRVELGSGLAHINDSRWADGCYNLEEIIVSPDNANFTSVDGILYSKDKTRLICFPYNSPVTDFILPDEVEVIEERFLTGFWGYITFNPDICKIEQITFSPNLRVIPEEFWGFCGEDEGIQSVIVPDTNPYFTVEDGAIYDKNKTSLLRYTNDANSAVSVPAGVSSIGAFAFSNLTLESLSAPESLSTIGRGAFSNTTIENDIQLPRSMKIIGGYAFANCDFDKIIIPKGVVEIDEAFSGNHTSTIVTQPGSLAEKYARRNNMYIEYTDFGDPELIYPEIIFEPSHSTILLGESAAISVAATSEFGDLSYQWYVDGTPAGTEDTYTFTPGETKDYNIFCIVANTYGGDTAQVKSKTVVVNCVDEVKSDINFGYDNWNFTNDYRYFNYDWDGFVYYEGSDNYEMKRDYLTILKNAFPANSALIDEFNRSPWQGSCFGMSAVEVLIKAGYLNPTFFQPTADETYYLTNPNHSYTTESMINYYHIMQVCNTDNMPLMMKNIQWWGDADNYKNNKTIVREVKNSKVVAKDGENNPTPVVLTFQYAGNAHAVVAYGYEFKNGKHTILISDPNDNTMPLVLTLNEDYSNPQLWTDGELHPLYNRDLVLRNTFSADELNYSNLQDKLTEFGKTKAAQRTLLLEGNSVAEQSYYFMNTNYDNFTVIYYDQAGEEKYRAVISNGIKIDGELKIYGMVISEAGQELKMLWQMPYLSESEYFEIVPNSTQDTLYTDMTYTDVDKGYYSVVEAGGEGSNETYHTDEGEIPVTGKGIITFYDDGYMKTEFPQQNRHRVILNRSGNINDLSTITAEGTADGIIILQSIYGLASVDVKTSGTLNVTLSDGINTVPTGDIGVVAGYPLTISSSAANDIIIQSSDGNMIQMAAGSAGHAVSFYTGGKLDVAPQTNIAAGETAEKPDIDEGIVIGWYTEPELINEWDFESDIVSENIVLFVKLAPNAVYGIIKSYNPGVATTLKLTQDGVDKYTTTIAATTGSGQVEQAFAFENVAAGTYSLEITKGSHTKITVNNLVVNDSVDLTQSSNSDISIMSLPYGDINGDGEINQNDLSILWQPSNYGKSVADNADPRCDLNGDGEVNQLDLAILWQLVNYNKGEIVID